LRLRNYFPRYPDIPILAQQRTSSLLLSSSSPRPVPSSVCKMEPDETQQWYAASDEQFRQILRMLPHYTFELSRGIRSFLQGEAVEEALSTFCSVINDDCLLRGAWDAGLGTRPSATNP